MKKMNHIKALVVNLPFERDIGNVVQIARSEGMKLYRKPSKIKVLDLINKPYGWICVIQNENGCSSRDGCISKRKT